MLCLVPITKTIYIIKGLHLVMNNKLFVREKNVRDGGKNILRRGGEMLQHNIFIENNESHIFGCILYLLLIYLTLKCKLSK